MPQGLTGLFIAVLVVSVRCQPDFNDKPTVKWKSSVPPMGLGNGVVVSPDSQVVYATSGDGTVSAMDPDDGNVTWSYQPPGTQGNGTLPLSCNGEISISDDGGFFVYGVTEGEDGEDQTCRVVALAHPAGDFIWISPTLEGECSGTPVISGDGKLIFLNHNSNAGSFGHFSILSFDEKGAALFSKTNPISPYAPPGIITNPIRGNFEGGESNTRDVIIWSYMPTPNATTVGPGSTFYFQLTSDFSSGDSAADFNVRVLSPDVSWQSTTAPLIVAQGLSMYWSVTRSELRAWVSTSNATGTNATGTNATDTNATGPDGSFDGNRTHAASFERGNPSFLAPFVGPIVDDSTLPKVLCVGSASAEFICLHADNLTTIWSLSTSSLIKTEARFSTNGDRVYFIEEDGILHACNTTSGDQFYEEETENPVISNFDLSIDGAFLYYGDETGSVVSLQLAESTLPPVMPVERVPSLAPPIVAPIAAPNMEPDSPTQFPTNSQLPKPSSSASQLSVITMVGVTSLAAFALLF